MGYFTNRRLQALVAPREFSIGPWLRDAQATFPNTWASTLVAAALQRVQFSEMVKSSLTYVGSKTMVGIGDRLSSSSPSELTVRAVGTDLVVLSLGGFGCTGVTYRPVNDWSIYIRVSKDLNSAIVEAGNLIISGTDVANERVLKHSFDAVADVLKVGVAIVRCEVGEGGFADLFGHSVCKTALSVNLTASANTEIPNSIGEILARQLDAMVGPAERGALEAQGCWPLVKPAGENWVINASDTRSLLLVGGSMYELLQDAGSTNDKEMYETGIRPLRALNSKIEVAFTEGSSATWPQIASSAQQFPVSLAFSSTLHSRSLMFHSAAAATMFGARWKTSKLPGAKVANFAARSSMSDVPGIVLGFGLLPSDPKAISPNFDETVRPPWWELRFDDSQTVPNRLDVRCEVMSLTHSRADGLVGSHTLIETLDMLVDHAKILGEPPTLLVADRNRNWG